MKHTAIEAARTPVHFIRSRDAYNVDCYFVLRASRTNMARLIAQKEKSPVDISHFGEILASGYGTPTRTTCEKLKQQYGLVIGDE